MVELKELQKSVYQNKVDKGFNTTDICMEFCLTHGELTEAFDAWRKKRDDVGEELADVAIYLLGLSEILNIDLESEILRKMENNKNRVYVEKNGVKIKAETQGK